MQIKVAVFSFFLRTRIFFFLIKNHQHIKGQVKKNWLASFFQKFYGWEGGFYFEVEILMLKYNKSYPYL